MRTLVTRFIQNQSGATAVEYSLLAALVAYALISALGHLAHSPSDTTG